MNNRERFWDKEDKDKQTCQKPLWSVTQSRGSHKAADTKALLFMKKAWEEGAARQEHRDGGGQGSGGLSLSGKLLCLYYIPSVSCYSVVPVSAERGLTKKSQERERPRREYQVTKDLLHPCPETSFSSKNNVLSRNRNEARSAGPGGGDVGERWRIDDTVRRNI